MAGNSRCKVYLSKNGKTYRFISHELTKSDGSIILNLLRDGYNDSSNVFDNVKLEPTTVDFESPRRKTKKITYHTSGCVNYHDTTHPTKYFEPLPSINSVNCFATWSLPKIESLDLHSGEISDNDFVVECNHSGRIYFSLCVANWNETPESPHIAVRYQGLFSLLIVVHAMPLKLPSEVESHFLFIAPRTGLYNSQQMSENNALIEFFQLSHKSKGLILFSPDINGIYKIIFATQMRSTPKLKIEFTDENLSLEIIPLSEGQIKSGKGTVMMRFKVKDQHNNYVKRQVKISSIELDSEL